MYEVISDLEADAVPAVPFSRYFYVLHAGLYWPFWEAETSLFSLGLAPAVQAGFNFSGNSQQEQAVNFLLQTPAYLALRWGANARPKAYRRIGAGLGIGGTFNFFSDQANRQRAAYLLPAAVAEFAARAGENNTLVLRLHFSLANTRALLRGDSRQQPRDFNGWGVGILLGF
jgi:hypothetical protein